MGAQEKIIEIIGKKLSKKLVPSVVVLVKHSRARRAVFVFSSSYSSETFIFSPLRKFRSIYQRSGIPFNV